MRGMSLMLRFTERKQPHPEGTMSGGGTGGAVTGGRRYEWCGGRREEVRVVR